MSCTAEPGATVTLTDGNGNPIGQATADGSGNWSFTPGTPLANGLETSRTEAAGTAQARTITTDWHPTLFLPVQVSEPGRITRRRAGWPGGSPRLPG